MSSFFDTLGLAEQVVNDESANIDGGAFPIINGGTNSISMITKMEWKDGFTANDPRFIQVTFQLTDTSFKDCYARCKIHINDADQKKRQKGANLFSRFYALCNIQPPAFLPTDQDLALFQNQMLGIDISYWCMQAPETGVWGHGNWVGSIFPAMGFIAFDGAIPVQDIAKLNESAVPAQSAPMAPQGGQQQAPQAPAPQQQQLAPAYQAPAPQQQAPAYQPPAQQAPQQQAPQQQAPQQQAPQQQAPQQQAPQQQAPQQQAPQQQAPQQQAPQQQAPQQTNESW